MVTPSPAVFQLGKARERVGRVTWALPASRRCVDEAAQYPVGVSIDHPPHAPFRLVSAAIPLLGGEWTGGGSVSLSDGSSERLRCRANYIVEGEGTALKQTLRCASDGYRFDLDSNVLSQGDSVSGTWSESSRNINGSLHGRAIGNHIAVFVEAAGFAANLSLTTHGSTQLVSITSEGEFKNVALELKRR